MSSILKALKKLEDEVSKSTVEHRRLQGIDTKRAIRKRVKNTRLLKKFLVLFCAVGVIVLGWIAIANNLLSIQKSLSAFTSAFNENKETARVGSGSALVKSKPPPVSRAKVKPFPAEPLNSPESPLPGLPIARKETSVGQNPVDFEPVKNSAADMLDRTHNEITSTQSATKSEPLTNQWHDVQREKGSVVIKRVVDSGLKLEGIAWSANPQDRIAIINGHIVQEGESIDGFSVTLIGKEDVIVQHKNENWKLVFGPG